MIGIFKLRKGLILTSLVSILTLAACSSGENADGNATGDEVIKLGLLEDHSGDFSLIGLQKLHAAELAVEEINENGGLLGKEVQLIAPDTQSDNTKYQELARKLILQDEVDVLMGAVSSASREAIRPIVEQNKILYFYNNQYEGGVASKYTFATGGVPEHQIQTLMEGLIKDYGPKVYVIAADYNFGQISADWVYKETMANGGEIVGEEFIPLGVSQFSSTISRIKDANPDVLITLLAGAEQSAFYGQWATSGMDIPMGTTVNMAQAYEHLRFEPPALENMYVTATFMEELGKSDLDIAPKAQEFVDKFYAKFPNDKYVGMEAEAEYSAIMLWAAAVEKAGTTETEAVIEILESGISYDGPAGLVTIDGKTHHAIRNVYLAHAGEGHEITFPKQWEAIVPNWLSTEKGVDLTTKDEFTQYNPLD